MPIRVSLLIVLFESSTFLLIFCLHALSINKRGMLNLQHGFVCFYLHSYQLLLMHFKTLLLCACIFRIVESSR